MTTFFPRYSESLTSFWFWSFNVKSGAACPTAIAIIPPDERSIYRRALRRTHTTAPINLIRPVSRLQPHSLPLPVCYYDAKYASRAGLSRNPLPLALAQLVGSPGAHAPRMRAPRDGRRLDGYVYP